ncbi:uncharacterized protein LOC109534189 isoform X4 [Dendroctonus ponderosae]|uniref:uncharacterized protein LOC109534189 isoform X4 n=1 Tax=Dendroctonus ponderosae TaxID=77166 RepID=UPI002034D452|nr:uncharacterized protein LOC109534189 isoform X4 [Dendroctonus ponderosae]
MEVASYSSPTSSCGGLQPQKTRNTFKIQMEHKHPSDSSTGNNPSLTHIEKYEKYLTESVQALKRKKLDCPKQKQIIFLLDLANLVVKNESSFNNLKSDTVLQELILISNPTLLETAEEVKLLFLAMLNSVLVHPSGVAWMSDKNYWLDVYSIILQHQHAENEEVVKAGTRFLATLLDKTVEGNQKFCTDFLQFLTTPILMTLQQYKEPKYTSLVAFNRHIFNDILPTALCLVNLLETLVENRCTQVLNVVLELRIREASDKMSSMSDKDDFTIIMYRIAVLLSFYEITVLFDGIKVINQSIMSISGIYRIFAHQTERRNMFVLSKVCYYAIKYSQIDAIHLPSYMVKDQQGNMECELMCFQLIPAMVAFDFLSTSRCTYHKLSDIKSCVLYSFGMEALRECNQQAYIFRYKIRNQVRYDSLDVYIQSFDLVLQTKPLYSAKNKNRIILILCCMLEDAFEYFKEVAVKRIIRYEEQMLVEKLFEIIVDFLETPNMCIDKHLKYLDLPKVMLLLIDSVQDSTMKDIGHMLFVKLFSIDWEVRQVALGVVTSISKTAHESFASFGDILSQASLPEVVTTLCLEDRNPLVRAAAFRSLQEMFLVNGIESKLKPEELTGKVLDTVLKETDPLASKEAIKLITVIYWRNRYTSDYGYLPKMYKCMEELAFTGKHHLVQEEVLRFWKSVSVNYMASVGWVDQSFPPIIFAKRIIRMTNEEVAKRVFWALSSLSGIGCLDIVKHFATRKDLSENVSTFIFQWMDDLYETYYKHKVTADFLKGFEENSTMFSASSNDLSKESEFDTDEIMHIVDQLIPVVEDEDGYMDLLSTSGLPERALDTNLMKTNPSDFVRLIYEKMAVHKKPKTLYEDVNYKIDY